MQGPRIQKGVFPLNAEKEKGVYWALMQTFQEASYFTYIPKWER